MEDKKLNILIYNSDLPLFPGTGAHEYLNTTQLAKWTNQIGLVSMAHTEEDLIKSVCLSQKEIQLFLWENPQIIAPLGRPLTQPKKNYLTCKKVIRKLLALAYQISQALIRRLRLQPSDLFFTDRVFRLLSQPLAEAFAKTHWQAFIVVQSSSAKVIDRLPTPFVSALVMHDVRSLLYERWAEASHLYWKKIYFRLQAKRYFYFEKKYCKKFDLTIALSQHDADWIIKHYQPKRNAIVPIPIDTHYFKPVSETQIIANRIVFTGHMAHPPNVDAAIYFVKSVFPLIKAKIPSAEFFIVGKTPTSEVQTLATVSGVTVTGTVPDARVYLATASVIVVPLRFGSGVRNKILEAWAMEKCVISTRIGAEGLEYSDGTHLLLADTAKDMANAVIQVLHNPTLRHQLSKKGRTVAQTKHCPIFIGQQYFQAIQQVAREKSQQQSTFRLAIDVRWMVPGLAGGIENVARSFIHELYRQPSQHHYTLMINHLCTRDFKLSHRPAIELFYQNHFSRLKNHCKLLLGKIGDKLRVEHTFLPTLMSLQFLRDLQVDMVYSFPGYIRPELHALPNILMVPDIQHEYLPEFFPGPILEERKRVYGDSIKMATHICAISEFTRQTLIDKLQIPPDKITTILLAADPIFTPIATPNDSTILTKYQLTTSSYIFFPAHTWHHKNHLAAIKALAILRDKYGLILQLVCTGGAREAQSSIEQAIDENHLQQQVKFLGYCPREDLSVLYREAICLIYPSLFEGFGMPVLEAMSSGCPVICSNTTSLPEIAEEAALFAHPADYESIADALFQITKNPDLSQSLKIKGLKQAKKFSWQKHTTDTIAVFERVFSQLRC